MISIRRGTHPGRRCARDSSGRSTWPGRVPTFLCLSMTYPFRGNRPLVMCPKQLWGRGRITTLPSPAGKWMVSGGSALPARRAISRDRPCRSRIAVGWPDDHLTGLEQRQAIGGTGRLLIKIRHRHAEQPDALRGRQQRAHEATLACRSSIMSRDDSREAAASRDWLKVGELHLHRHGATEGFRLLAPGPDIVGHGRNAGFDSHRLLSDRARTWSPSPRTFAAGRQRPADRLHRSRCRNTTRPTCRNAAAGTPATSPSGLRPSECRAAAFLPR